MLRPLALALLVFAVAGCDTGDAEAQRLFEDEALLSPVEGITRVEADGTVGSRDANDWRIGPAFRNRVSLLALPAPNPLRRGQALSFPVDTQGVPGGLRLLVLERDPLTGNLDFEPLRDFGADQPGASQPGFYTFSVSANQPAFASTGLYRLLMFDGSNQIVTYGDVEIRP
ncbi:hypothetical protein [Rubrivirga sp. IMCC43871]|uniref:hypothetical protein n=1 Tax=Rubrivirga sp. IMCC43871 TaxID=3391575 RepID=UPI00398FF370